MLVGKEGLLVVTLSEIEIVVVKFKIESCMWRILFRELSSIGIGARRESVLVINVNFVDSGGIANLVKVAMALRNAANMIKTNNNNTK